MAAPHRPWELSFYACVMRWTGQQMVFEPETVRATFAILRAAGIRWIGVDGINLLEAGNRAYADVVRETRGWLEEFGLRLSSFHYAGPTYAALERGQDQLRQGLLESVELFSAWRPKAFVIHAGWILGENTTGGVQAAFEAEAARHGADAVLQSVAANLKVMARAAAPHGIQLAVENLGPYDALATRDTLPRLVAAIDEPNAGYCLDAGHAHLGGESVADWVRLMGPRLFETHFHDNRGRGVDEHWPVGFGTVSWIDVIQALDEVGFPGPVTFEATGWPLADRVDGYRQAIAWWRAAEEFAAQVRARAKAAPP